MGDEEIKSEEIQNTEEPQDTEEPVKNKQLLNYLIDEKHFLLLKKANSNRYDTAKKLSLEINLSPNHLVDVMRNWEANGMIQKVKEGIENKITLTSKGRSILDTVEDAVRLLNK